ncbi:MAG: DUF975 family protein [Clostridia bacterium]|nr:DUF975 family protein [Clostridia bacterium]
MVIYSSGYWKMLARRALKEHWLTALLIALVVNLPSLLVQGIAAMTGNDLLTQVQELLYGSLSESGLVNERALISGLQALEESTGIWVMQGLNIVAWLLTPCLTLGMVSWMLSRHRGQEDPGVTGVFSRMNLFFKGIGLRLYTAWRVFLFMLPGVLLSVAALLPLWLSDSSSRISVLSAANTSLGLQSAAMMATIALGIIAAMKYALGDMVLADHPDMGPIRAAKESKRLTQGKKGQLFFLYTSFLFWYLLEMMVSGVVLDMLGAVPALMVQMLISLAISVYLHMAVSAFYLGCVAPPVQPGGPIIDESGIVD